MDEPDTRYRSRVDWWLGLLIVAVPATSVVAALALHADDQHGEALIAWAVLAGVLVLYAALVWPVEYVLERETLVIRFGVIRSRVPYHSIRSVRPSRSLLAAPALSIHRMAIDRGTALPVKISPADASGFLDDLAGRAPHLVRGGNVLTPR
jgi:hypothetical protein